MKQLTAIPEITAAVDAGHDVRCDGGGYEVIKDSTGEYLIHFRASDYYIGLHGRAGTKYADHLNGRGFYIARAAVTKHTRAGRAGKEIYCPHCGSANRVYHFAWCATTCQSCRAMVDKYDWFTTTPKEATT